MATNTITHTHLTSAKHNESNSRKKRSSHHPSNHKQLKSQQPKWRSRQVRPHLKLNAEERNQAYELLKKFSGPKKFVLPVDLPPWSPPSKLEEITSELSIFRDYGCNLDEWDRPEPREEHTRQLAEPKYNQNDRTKTSAPNHNQSSQQSTSSSHPPTTTAINTTAAASPSSVSPDTFSSPSELVAKPVKATNPDQQHQSAPNGKLTSEPQRDRPPESIKGKEKCDPEIDWAGWESQTYNNTHLERLQLQYAHRAKEFKRLSDAQRHQVTQARAALPDPKVPLPPSIAAMSDLSAVGCVDSLLLFTQSFLATELTRPTISRADRCAQWSSMIAYLEVAKATTRRSGIQLTYAICLMYESLLLDRLVEADRPILLQTYSHETNTEKLLDGFTKLKRIMNYQEISKASWLSAEKMFDRILSFSSSSSSPPTTTGGPADADTSYRTVNLPKLRASLQGMPRRQRNNTPRILSVDRPYRFCWPLDKTNLDSMADFVAFSRSALDEFVEINHDKIRFQLARFDDHNILFPSTPK